jgi:hypothetical protein
MTEPEPIVRDLETRRHSLLLRQVSLRSGLEQLAYDALVGDSWSSRQKLRSVEDRLYDLEREITLHDLALEAARHKADTVGCTLG